MILQRIALIALTVFAVSSLAPKAHAEVKAEAASASCAGCATLVQLEEKYSKLDPKDDDKGIELSNAASKAIGKLPTGKKQKLSSEQMMEIAKLLNAARPTDPEDALIDNNIKLFNANKIEFFEIFKKFPKAEAEELRLSLDSKLGEYYYGNDPEAVRSRK